MAGTLTFDCSTAGVAQARTVRSESDGFVQVAEITLTPSGEYDRDASESIEITNIPTLIQNSRRNGKTVTLIGAMPGQSTSYSGTKYRFLTAVLNTATVDATISDSAGTEYTDGANLPAFEQAMSVYVAFTEA